MEYGKALNLSNIPKYFCGNTAIPTGPMNIIPIAIAAQIPTPFIALSLHPAMIRMISETIDSKTTQTVTTL